jgi:hypothetical protein
VIMAINGKPVSKSTDVPAAVSELAPGSATQLQIIRAGQPVTIKVFIAMATQDGAGAPSSGIPDNTVNRNGGSPGPGDGRSALPPGSASTAGQDAWRPDGQVGDLQFNVPDGWKQTQTPNGVVLSPGGLSQNSIVMVGFLPRRNGQRSLHVVSHRLGELENPDQPDRFGHTREQPQPCRIPASAELFAS